MVLCIDWQQSCRSRNHGMRCEGRGSVGSFVNVSIFVMKLHAPNCTKRCGLMFEYEERHGATALSWDRNEAGFKYWSYTRATYKSSIPTLLSRQVNSFVMKRISRMFAYMQTRARTPHTRTHARTHAHKFQSMRTTIVANWQLDESGHQHWWTSHWDS